MNTIKMFAILVSVYLVYIHVLTASAIDDVISEYNKRTDNGYEFHFETKNGISRTDKGIIGTDSNGDEILRVSGSYSFITPDGQKITVVYKADENGYKPEVFFDLDGSGLRTKSSDGHEYIDNRIGSAAIASLTGGGMG